MNLRRVRNDAQLLKNRRRMQMNLNINPTIEQLRALLRQADDSVGHHVLWVKRSGEVELSRIPGERTPLGFEKDHPEMQMRYETFMAGNEYVGPEAAEDGEWVSELFNSLLKEWPKARGKPEVASVVISSEHRGVKQVP
jgi:hypothetical protein